jgi:hypothetical protein
MSQPPPSSAPPGGSGPREHVLELETPKSWRRRRGPLDLLRLSAMGASIAYEPALHTPLRLSLGTLQLGLVDPGPARPDGMTGRFPILKRLSATAVIPREHGIEGWLWTSLGGSALTVLGDPEDAPNAALLFTKPLGDTEVACFEPEIAQAIAARSPLGAPAVYGLLFRVADTTKAETVFRQFGLLRPVTDHEVPPTLRRALPTDRAADPVLAARENAHSSTSVPPPGHG